MKNHNFNDAMDIFAKMFEGWNIVCKSGTYPLTSANPVNGLMFSYGVTVQEKEVSHIQQTKPMHGDEVWAYDNKKIKAFGVQARYIGATSKGYHICEQSDGEIELYRHVELIAPFKTLTIEEAEKMLKELKNENYKITCQK